MYKTLQGTLLISFVLLTPISGKIQAQTPHEYQVKAVFLYNFAMFIKWPQHAFANDRSPIIVGVLGKDPFGPFLDEAIRGETADQRPLIIQHYRQIDEIKQCHILFVSRSEQPNLERVLATLRGRPVLTVADFDGFARSGGMIRFVTIQNRIRMRVNLEAVKLADLEISSKLLRASDIIKAGQD